MTEQDRKEPPEDRELEEFLARRSDLSRRYREGAQEQAPPQLEAKVLDTARKGLRRAGRRRLLRWDNPLALAASALLVVGLGWLTLQRQAPPPAVVTEAVAPPGAPARASSATAVADRVADEPKDERAGQAQDELKAAKQDEAPAPPPPAAANLSQRAPRPFPLPRQPAATPAEAETADAAGGSAAEPAPPAAARDKAGLAATPPSSPAPPREAPAASPSNAPAAAAPVLPAMPEAAADPCASPRRAGAQPEQELDGPEWLERIRQLQKTDAAAARAELACFVARRPQAQVPEDLRPLLPQGIVR